MELFNFQKKFEMNYLKKIIILIINSNFIVNYYLKFLKIKEYLLLIIIFH